MMMRMDPDGFVLILEGFPGWQLTAARSPIWRVVEGVDAQVGLPAWAFADVTNQFCP